MKRGGASLGIIRGARPSMDEHCGDGWPPVVERWMGGWVKIRAGRIRLVVDRVLTRNDAHPTAFDEATLPLTNADGVRQTIRNIPGADADVAVEHTIERLVLV